MFIYNYLGFFIYQLIILWTISINWHRWLLVNNHISKYNSFILVLYRTTSPGKLVPTLVEVTTFPSWWRTMGLLLFKGFKDGSWRRQTGINPSIYAALVCNNLPLQILMIPCLSSLPSWRTLQKKLFLRLRQYQNVSINRGFLTFAKMQSKRNRALERFKREPTEGNLNAYRIARAKARRDIRHSKRTSWRNYVSKMNSQT